MMHFTLGANKNEVVIDNGPHGGTHILYSYDVPVAYWTKDGSMYKTDKKWSTTTSGHINSWIAGSATVVSQDEMNAFVRGL